MIKFFRRIRQQLLTENKFSKYLIYAIGEIFLVVVGILIALQINNWNENNKVLAKEKVILASLLEDFEDNSRNIRFVLNSYTGAVDMLERKLTYVGKNANDFDQDMKDDLINIGYAQSGLVSGALNSLLNSDQLALIQNDELKKLLTSYPYNMDIFNDQLNEILEYIKKTHAPLMDSYISVLERSYEQKAYPELLPNVMQSDYNGLLNDVRFQNLIFREIKLIISFNNSNNYFLDRTNYIVDLIRVELELPIKLERLVNSDKTIDEVIEIMNQQDVDDPVYDISENSINDLGYKFMEEDQYNKALKLFKLNTELYPEAWNTHDSYGECLLKMGDEENAIKAYRKSLELNPDLAIIELKWKTAKKKKKLNKLIWLKTKKLIRL
jgi:tetratricopeptide (TPR) repeat protein